MRRKNEKPNPTLELMNTTPLGKLALAEPDKHKRLTAIREYMALQDRRARLVGNLRATLHEEVRRRVTVERWYQERINGAVPQGVQWPCPV